jgi:large subunit ribosomal protein L4e
MTQRPVVSLYSSESGKEKESGMAMPEVFSTPIRNDIVHYVHSRLAKNRRQGHAVFYKAGAEHSAESWGTGRAVARIPRISGSGTSRSGQATFGNMCRKARMFAPLKIWRKWHAKANITQRRHAVATALAASACTPLVMARGHSVDTVPELPLVVDAAIASDTTTSKLLTTLTTLGCAAELAKVSKSKKIRSGKGKYRNSRYVMRKGPLIIYSEASKNVKQAARNLPGVDVCNVHRLNILQLAPGGHLGRFCIFTKDAFDELNSVFGTYAAPSTEKKGYTLPRPVMSCADLSRIINSDQVQAKLKDIKHITRAHDKTKKNPLTNKAMMLKLNPYAKKAAELRAKLEKERNAKRAAVLKEKRSKAGKKAKQGRNTVWKNLQGELVQSFKDAEDVIAEEEKAGNYVPGDTTEEEEDDE